MHAEQLRVAVDKVVDKLAASGVLSAIRDYRTAKGDQRPVAAARLGHAGGMLMEQMSTLTSAEEATLKLLHLHNLRDTAYWQDLLNPAKPETNRAAELVHLYSRVLFASNHLPNFAALLDRVDQSAAGSTGSQNASFVTAPLEEGESRLAIQLSDAGEKASDPDRIARSIDGIDMLYSACASLSRRPAMDLRLDYVSGDEDRSITFTGETDSVSAMSTVIDSIPDALASLNDDQEIDLDALVDSLPIFSQLNTLAGQGAFSEKDLRDIRETMHQGALLTLESGVVLKDSPTHKTSEPSDAGFARERISDAELFGTQSSDEANAAAAIAAARRLQASQQDSIAVAEANTSAAMSAPLEEAISAAPSQLPEPEEPVQDEHYERYLAERAAMQNSSAQNTTITPADDDPFPMLENAIEDSSVESVDADKQAAVEELLRSLNQQREG